MFNIRNQEQAIRETQIRLAYERQNYQATTQSTLSGCQHKLVQSALKTTVTKVAKRVFRKRNPHDPSPQKRRTSKKLMGVAGIAISAWLIYSSRYDKS